MHGSEEGEWRNSLLAELTDAQALVIQLQTHIDQPSHIELCKSLASKILSSINKSIFMVKPSDPDNEEQPLGQSDSKDEKGAVKHSDPKDEKKAVEQSSPDDDNQPVERSDKENEKHAVESSVIIVESPQSSPGPFFIDQIPKEKCKKRKTTLPTWNVTTPYFDDGYIWRKYGQKVIHGAKYPRMYYRCNHGDAMDACTAKKQIQQLSDEDPPVYDVTYLGTHTCQKKFQLPPSLVHREQEQQQKQPNCQRNNQRSHALHGNKDTMQSAKLAVERNSEKCSSNITDDRVMKSVSQPMRSGYQQLHTHTIASQQVKDATVPVQPVPYIEFSIISKK